jgi:uncharacterized protein (UPF0548 family)
MPGLVVRCWWSRLRPYAAEPHPPRRGKLRQVDLYTISHMPLTYPEVGATAGPPPPGYRHLGFVSQVGAGHQRYQEAADALMHWGMQRGAGLRVEASSDVVEVGAVVLVKMGFLKAPCRVVYVIDEPGVRGFAYGTLPGHPESGEERFVVRHDPITAAVYAEVSAFSRPATWWSKAGGPFTSLAQRVIAKRYVRAV